MTDTSSWPTDEGVLRSVIREVLGDLLGQAEGTARTAPARASGHGAPRSVAVSTQDELDALVSQILQDAADPKRRAAWQNGQVRARLEVPRHLPSSPSLQRPSHQRPNHDRPAQNQADTQTASSPEDSAAGVIRIDKGAVTERIVRQAAADGGRLVLGPKAVMTPLAKERARRSGVVIDHADASISAGPNTRGS